MELNASFSIVNLEVLQSHADGRLLSELITEFNFKLEAQIKLDPDRNLAISIVDVVITPFGQDAIVGAYTAAVFFEIQNFDDILRPEGQLIEIPDVLVGSLNSIAISTIRGMMFEAFKGTILHSAILPVVDIQQMLKTRKNS